MANHREEITDTDEAYNFAAEDFSRRMVEYRRKKGGKNSGKGEILREKLNIIHPECKIIVCIPVAGHQESSYIYTCLESYTGQIDIHPDEFEINLLVNIPSDNETEKYSYKNTMMEIGRFSEDYPTLHVNISTCKFEKNDFDMGNIRGTLTDSVLFRPGIKGNHIIVSHDADQMAIHRRYLRQILDTFRNTDIEIIGGKVDEDEITHLNHPIFFVKKRFQKGLCSRYFNTSGANSAFLASSYVRVGGYNCMGGGIAEDTDLGKRITESASGKKNGGYKIGRGVLRVRTSGRRMVEKLLTHGEIPNNYAWHSFDVEGNLVELPFDPDDSYRGLPQPVPQFEILEGILRDDESWRIFLIELGEHILKDQNLGLMDFYEKHGEILAKYFFSDVTKGSKIEDSKCDEIHNAFLLARKYLGGRQGVLEKFNQIEEPGREGYYHEFSKNEVGERIKRACRIIGIDDCSVHFIFLKNPLEMCFYVRIIDAHTLRAGLEKFLKRMKEKYQQEKQPG